MSDLTIDGYLSTMLGSVAATSHIACIVRVPDLRGLRLVYDNRWPDTFFFVTPTGPGALAVIVNDRYNAWIIDHRVRSDLGTVVPQRIWGPRNPADIRRYVTGDVQLNLPVFFTKRDGSVGLPLVSAAAGDCMSLLKASSTAPVGEGHTADIHINWCGYADWVTQIMIRDQTPHRRTITLEKLAKRIASGVIRFLEGPERREQAQGRRDQEYRKWRVEREQINKRRIWLIGLVQVSQGSWQPILQLDQALYY
ncbi:hypothetical protein BC834DRAFT_861988 [Gloeopeniophorella convolvens]|nr:hypothetical protein BC834DRAFT_861988 [Gloeopeniophorella convolvens]